jgi:hypothetical protein
MPKADHRRSILAHIIELFRRSRLVRYWTPVFIWMAGISYFSSRPDPLAFLPPSRHGIDIGSLAHIGEYAGLAALLHRALANGRWGDGERERLENGKGRGEGGNWKRRSSPPLHVPLRCPELVEGSLCLLFAVLDELHQELVPGRGFELADIGYDLAGIIAALGVIWVRKK